MKKIYIKDRKRKKYEFQFFMHDFVDACSEVGFEKKTDLFPSYSWHIRAVLKIILFFLYRLVHCSLPHAFKRKEALIVTANGVTLLDNAFPYYGKYEIVPMLWDVWPSTWERMYRSFYVLDVKTIFTTSHQVEDMINRNTDIHAHCIHEGINSKKYKNDLQLKERKYDIFEMGRRFEKYHRIIELVDQENEIMVAKPSNLNKNGTLNDKKIVYTNDELYDIMSKSKIMVCFPQCDTNPGRAGNIETLTIRYWEAMLSGCVIIGRAPNELINLIGYNPVIEVDWERAQEQLEEILFCIENFQSLVDKNYKVAQKYAPWESRMPFFIQKLRKEGYEML